MQLLRCLFWMVTGLMSEARNAVASAMGPLFDMGVKAERERIIALLEDYCDGVHSALDGCECSLQIGIVKGD